MSDILDGFGLMKILVTGAAGFIGSHVCQMLLARGDSVIGVDILNDYYDVTLKYARRDRLADHDAFTFAQVDISDRSAMEEIARQNPDIAGIVHLAAQAGVRYSIENPYAYAEANLMGHLVMLEMGRSLEKLQHLVYASSSSVYGGNTKVPFSTADRTDTPISLYAATKKADELMSHCYSHLYRIPMTGLRFFTVYGPWGRPDMAAYIFATAITEGKPIRLFNNGDMMRDFTYIDDIVAGILGCLAKPPAGDGDTVPHAVYNLGNSRSEKLTRYVELIEEALGRKADIRLEPMQPGDVKATFAEIADSRKDFGYDPQTPIDVGIPRFNAWVKCYHSLNL
jgi:UDP-glucuronate 4-epimerase